MLDVFDFTDPQNASKIITLGSKFAPILKRRSTIEINGAAKIPEQWHLDGDLTKDPIAQATMVRLNTGGINRSTDAPNELKIKKMATHQYEAKKGLIDVIDFTKPSIQTPKGKTKLRKTVSDAAST